MSGPFAAYGKQIEHGVKLWLSQNGESAGGRKVELLPATTTWHVGRHQQAACAGATS
jgi:hypothetical protein